MKLKSLLSLLLAVLMIFSVCACGEQSSTIDDWEDDGDTLTEDEINDDGPIDVTSGSGTTSASDPGNTPGGQTTSTTTPTQGGKKTNLSWAEVKKTIPASAKGKTIEIMDWNGVENVAQAKGVIDSFTKETGIKVKFTTEAYDTYSTKIAARVAAGNPPDVVRIREEIPKWVKYLQPVNNLKYNFNDSAWDTAVLNAYTFNGKTYGLNMVDSPYFQPEIVAYNTQLIKQYKLEDPYTIWSKNSSDWTWDKLHDIAEKFVKAAGQGYIGITGVFGEYAFSCGAPWVSFNGTKYTCNMGNGKFVKAWQLLAKECQKGIYNKNAYTLDDFNRGKELFHIDAEINLRNGHFAFKSLKEKAGAIKAVPLPCVKGQSEYYIVMAETQAYGIPQGAKNADLVPYFLRYFLDVKNYDMNKFYCDNSTKTGSIYSVVQWCRNPKYRRLSTLSTLMDGDDGYCGYAEGGFYINMMGSGNVKTDLDQTYKPGLTDACNEATKQIAKMK